MGRQNSPSKNIMAKGTWKLISIATAVQVLSEVVFFAQGILANEETISSVKKEFDWMQICVPLFYAATRQISEPCWRWIFGGYGDRTTTALGAATIAISVLAAASQEILVSNAIYVILGGLGNGLVRLQVKLMKSHSGDADLPFWGSSISGLGLSLWPLMACLFVRSYGTRYAMLIFAGITLHAVPMAMFVRPRESEDQPEDPDEEEDPVRSSTSPDMRTAITHQEYRLSYQLIEWDSHRVRPSYYVEVLPGIPEETEHESSDQEMQRAVVEVAETSCNREITGVRRKESTRLRKIEAKPFAYTLFVTTILLRLGDQLGVIIGISVLPIFAGYVIPNVRIQEKAFLLSICGFSKILTELPLLILFRKTKKTRFVILGGPLFAAVGLYLTWNSMNLDSLTMSSFALGIGSGAASAALHILTPRESPVITDTADIVVGVCLLAVIPLMRILVLKHAVHDFLLLAVGLYTGATITMVHSLRKAA